MHTPMRPLVSTPSSFFSACRGFTLVEILAVICIIGILVALTIPVIGNVRDRAKVSRCSANLRQLGQAFHLFAAEHRGRLPQATDDNGIGWRGKLEPYLGWGEGANVAAGVGECPAVNKTNDKRRNTYGMNTRFYDNSAGNHTTTILARIAFPAKQMLATETWWSANTRIFWLESAKGRNYGMSYPHGSQTFESRDGSGEFQGDKANILFVDGHVKLMHADEIPANWPALNSTPEGQVFWTGGTY